MHNWRLGRLESDRESDKDAIARTHAGINQDIGALRTKIEQNQEAHTLTIQSIKERIAESDKRTAYAAGILAAVIVLANWLVP